MDNLPPEEIFEDIVKAVADDFGKIGLHIMNYAVSSDAAEDTPLPVIVDDLKAGSARVSISASFIMNDLVWADREAEVEMDLETEAALAEVSNPARMVQELVDGGMSVDDAIDQVYGAEE